VETTERHLGCKQRLRRAVNDNFGLNRELDGAGTKPMSGFLPETPLFVHNSNAVRKTTLPERNS